MPMLHFSSTAALKSQIRRRTGFSYQSPKVATYDIKPEMSAYEVTDAVIEKIRSGSYDCIILNFANADMVGHTGVFDAAVKLLKQ